MSRSVIVSGGSTGIGLAAARRFGAAGDAVVISGRTESTLEAARAELAREGIAVTAVRASVADAADVRRVVETAVELNGGVDVVVANAGVGPESPIVETSEADWDEIFDTNLKGAFLLSREAAGRMIERGRGGVVLFTGSINAVMPVAPAVAYSASKAGLEAFVKGLAVELAPHGIRVCAVHPGYIETPLLHKVYSEPEQYDAWVADRTSRIPLGRLGGPEEVAAAFWFLASDEASYITGTSLLVDGGRFAAH